MPPTQNSCVLEEATCRRPLLVPRTPKAYLNLILSVRQIGVPLGGMVASLLMPPLTLAWGWQAALVAQLVPVLVLGILIENYGGAFRLPERGPIGANCLANSRDFLTPKAHYEDREAPSTLYLRAQGVLWKTQLSASPLDVVAWHGNYAPYKYDLRRFSPVGSILFDHPDPSIFTVLTAPSDTPGMANIDLVIFPERWLTMENTFRPPWYHVNIMSEFMGLLYGQYDAKPHGFQPGGVSLHNSMLPHGPDMEAFEHASNVALVPVKLANTMAFMFESRFPQRVTEYAATAPILQPDYFNCWTGLKKHFDPTRP
jgi:homogentisate 1,2-dioxygenase